MSTPHTTHELQIRSVCRMLQNDASALREACTEVSELVHPGHMYYRDAQRLETDAEFIEESVNELVAPTSDHRELHDELSWRVYDVRKTLDILSIAEACDMGAVSVASTRQREVDRRLWELYHLRES